MSSEQSQAAVNKDTSEFLVFCWIRYRSSQFTVHWAEKSRLRDDADTVRVPRRGSMQVNFVLGLSV